MEKEKSFDSDGDIADFGARIFDANYPVFLSRDPKQDEYPYQSPYLISENNPVLKIDVNGEWAWVINNWLDKYSKTKLGLVTKISQATDYTGATFSNLLLNNMENIQSELNEYVRKWSNPKSKKYAPKIGSYLKEEQINVVIADLSEVHLEDGINGFVPNNENIIFLEKDLFEKNGSKELNSENTFLHEIVHSMGGDEFQAFSASLSAGTLEEEDIEKFFNSEKSTKYLLQGSGLDINDFFGFINFGDSQLYDDKDQAERPRVLFKDKRKEFFKIMRKTGEKYTGKKQ